MFSSTYNLRSLLILINLVAVFAFADAGSAATQPGNYDLPQPLIEKMISNLLNGLNANAEKIHEDPSVAYKLSDKLVVPYLDFPRITRIIIGKYWRNANAEQRQRLIDEISALLTRSYVTAMSAYADDTLTDDQVTYLPSRYRSGDKKASVHAAISLDSGQTIDVQYRLYRTDGEWKIYDISFENISLALTYRASFSSIIKKDGVDALITQLEQRNEKGVIDLPGVVAEKIDVPAATGDKKHHR
ncbi:hypothetical protein MNBD_GAMMA13-1483 [hydrothermal vent metagenome]|uniref:Phospholipid ABC transporter shuttle protein MlaC n=1 Tax=hydrothermal vent metagenome TaxID=652676 RepID=A0A3B0YPC2_9ZZZZ